MEQTITRDMSENQWEFHLQVMDALEDMDTENILGKKKCKQIVKEIIAQESKADGEHHIFLNPFKEIIEKDATGSYIFHTFGTDHDKTYELTTTIGVSKWGNAWVKEKTQIKEIEK